MPTPGTNSPILLVNTFQKASVTFCPYSYRYPRQYFFPVKTKAFPAKKPKILPMKKQKFYAKFLSLKITRKKEKIAKNLFFL